MCMLLFLSVWIICMLLFLSEIIWGFLDDYVYYSSCLAFKLSLWQAFLFLSQYDNILMEEAAQILEIETFIPLLLQVRNIRSEAKKIEF